MGPGGVAAIHAGEGLISSAANVAIAERQMAFQERMSSTAHQREVRDLKAAGLNPILSAKYGGSSTPAGASATIQPSSAAQAYYNTKLLKANIDKVLADVDVSKETAKTQRSQQQVNSAQAASIKADVPKKQVQGSLWKKAGEAISPALKDPVKTWKKAGKDFKSRLKQNVMIQDIKEQNRKLEKKLKKLRKKRGKK